MGRETEGSAASSPTLWGFGTGSSFGVLVAKGLGMLTGGQWVKVVLSSRLPVSVLAPSKARDRPSLEI